MLIDPLANEAHRIPGNVLRLQAESRPDAPYLIDPLGASTYAEVDARADAHAGAYADLGIGPGDAVAFLLDNSADLAATSFGVNRAGGLWSPVSTEYRGEWLYELLSDVRGRVLVVDRHLVPELERLTDVPFEHVVVRGGTDGVALPATTVHDFAAFDGHSPLMAQPALHHGQTNAVLWTSGTTGRSKGVMQSHAVWMLWSQRHNDVFRNGIRDGERFYYCMPLYNSGGWIMSVYPALIGGAAACIDKRFSVTGFWDRIRHYGASHTMTLGTMHVYLMQQEPKPDDRDNPLRTLVMNPVIPAIMEPFMERFGIEAIASGFGQSEIMGATFFASGMSLKPGSCGHTGEDDLVETRLLDDNDEEVATGVTGEICVRPRVPYAIFNGYHHEPEQTLETFRNFWHHSGDLGRRDEDGEIFFVDRKKDSLRHKGRNTSTFEVEHIARQFPGVLNVAAVGVAVSDLEHEEELMVVLLRAPGAHLDELTFCQFMDEKAPYFFVPRYVRVVDELPMTPTNKIQKFVLRDLGVTSDTWDRTVSAGQWQPTRPTSSPARVKVTA